MLKNRDSHLVELPILCLLVFFVCIFIKNCVFHRPREVWPIFDQKWRVVTSQNRPYLKHLPTDFNKIFTDDVKLLYETVCQVSRRLRCSFLSYREYSRGGVKRPPPPVKRGLMDGIMQLHGGTVMTTQRAATVSSKTLCK